jgi:mitochondrial fission protein ELM1
LAHRRARSNNISQKRQEMALPAGLADETLAAVAGRSGWIISDGKAGNDVQSRGVSDALGLAYEVKRVDPKGIWKALSPWGPVDPAERFGAPGSSFHPPWPEFAISIGRLTTPYLRKLKQLAGFRTYAVILLDPRVSARTADLFWVPEHDTRRGPNVITTLTAPHGFTAHRLAELRSTTPPAIAALPQPRVAVALGGPNGDYRYTPQTLERLARALHAFAGKGAGLMITNSRRTPADVTAYVRAVTEGLPRLFWEGEGENPYPHFLAHADYFIVPADSVNMCGEACATGKPVYVFEPEGGSAKFRRFHDALRRHGATRPLPAGPEQLETWSYPPLNSAETIAREIARRWLKRRQMLGPRASE